MANEASTTIPAAPAAPKQRRSRSGGSGSRSRSRQSHQTKSTTTTQAAATAPMMQQSTDELAYNLGGFTLSKAGVATLRIGTPVLGMKVKNFQIIEA